MRVSLYSGSEEVWLSEEFGCEKKLVVRSLRRNWLSEEVDCEFVRSWFSELTEEFGCDL